MKNPLTRLSFGLLLAAATAFLCGCNQPVVTTLKQVPLDDPLEILQPESAQLDRMISRDGAGSLRFQIDHPQTLHLMVLSNPSIENCLLTYQAALRTENLSGRVYLEMWCAFDSLGEYFSRDLGSPILSSTDWVVEQTPFLLKDGQRPDRIFLNVVCEGTGTVWVDDILLYTTTS